MNHCANAAITHVGSIEKLWGARAALWQPTASRAAISCCINRTANDIISEAVDKQLHTNMRGLADSAQIRSQYAQTARIHSDSQHVTQE